MLFKVSYDTVLKIILVRRHVVNSVIRKITILKNNLNLKFNCPIIYFLR